MDIRLEAKHTPGAVTRRTSSGWKLEIPTGPARSYRLSQVDDYASLPRNRFRFSHPVFLRLDARVSAANLPGTWGFGLWNDPFGFAIGFGGTVRRLPCLPNAAWFFHASPPNWLSLREGFPGDGFFAGTTRAPHIPPGLLLPGLLPASLFLLPMLAIRPFSRWLRRLAARIIPQESASVRVDVTAWHEYSFAWQQDQVEFKVDGTAILATKISPKPPLGLVIWIDNQYAFWNPGGRLGYGTLETPGGWLEIAGLQAGA